MAFGYGYGGYPSLGGYYAPPMPDQLAQLRQGTGQYQQPMMGQQPMAQGPMAQPMQQVQQTTPQAAPAIVAPAQPSSNGILWVQGEEGAKAWMVAPGSTVMLMDSDGSSFYLKSADPSGMPQPLRIFDYKERVNEPKTPVESTQIQNVEYVTVDRFNDLAARYDALEAELDALKNKPCKCAPKKAKEDVNDG